MLVIVGIDGIRDKNLDWADSIPVKPVHQNRVHRQSFINDIGLPYGRVDIDFRVMLNRRLTGGYRRHIAHRARRNQAASRLTRKRAIWLRLGNVAGWHRAPLSLRLWRWLRYAAIRKVGGKSRVVRKLTLLGRELLGLLLRRGELRLTTVLLSVSSLWTSLPRNTRERLARRTIRSGGCTLRGRRGRKCGVVDSSGDSGLLLFLQLFGLKLTLQIGNIVIGIVLHHRLRRLVLGRCLVGWLFATGTEDCGQDEKQTS